MKFWKNIGMDLKDAEGRFVAIDDSRFGALIDFITDQGVPIIGHVGEPRNCWLPLSNMTVKTDRAYYEGHPEYHMYLHPEYPSYEHHLLGARPHAGEASDADVRRCPPGQPRVERRRTWRSVSINFRRCRWISPPACRTFSTQARTNREKVRKLLHQISGSPDLRHAIRPWVRRRDPRVGPRRAPTRHGCSTGSS